MMFPQVDLPTEVEAKSQEDTYGKSYLYDFQKGDFVLQNGRLVEVEDIEALKVWIDKIIRTEKFRFSIYGEYGIKFEDLVGGIYDRSFLVAEMRREIKEALNKHPLISDVTNIDLIQENDKTIVSFHVVTKQEEFNKEVVMVE